MSFAVRTATTDDAAELAALEVQARAALVPNRGGAAWLAEHPPVGEASRWEAVIEHGDVWVAAVDGLVVGFLQLAIDHPLARVRQVFVRPEARGLGFGEHLLSAAIDHARNQRCVAIDTEALPGDRDTKNLYERAGITARLLVLRRTLGELHNGDGPG